MDSPAVNRFSFSSVVYVLLTVGNSLFIGLKNGIIEEWNNPGQRIRTYNGHTFWIRCLLECEGKLWSVSYEKITLWNVHTGECMKTVHMESAVYCLCEWKGNIISGGYYHYLTEWNSNGELQYKWDTTGTTE